MDEHIKYLKIAIEVSKKADSTVIRLLEQSLLIRMEMFY